MSRRAIAACKTCNMPVTVVFDEAGEVDEVYAVGAHIDNPKPELQIQDVAHLVLFDGGVLAGWFTDFPTGCLSVLPQTTDCFEGDQLDGIVADGDDMVWQATLEVEDGRRSEGFGAWPHGRDAALVRAWVEFPHEQPTKDPA